MDESMQYCQGCLSSGRNLRPLFLMQSLLEFLALDKMISIQGGICWECVQAVKKFTRFKQRIQKTQELLKSNLQGPKHSLSTLTARVNASLEFYSQENSSKLEKMPALHENRPVFEAVYDPEIKQEIECDYDDQTYSDEEATDIFEDSKERLHKIKEKYANTDEKYAKTIEIYAETKEIYAETKEVYAENIEEIFDETKEYFSETKDFLNKTQVTSQSSPAIYVDVLKTMDNETTKKETEIELQEKELMETFEKVIFTEEEMLKRREEKRNQPNYKKMPFKCDSCVLAFTKKDNFDVHMKKHAKNVGIFSCPVCCLRFTTEYQVERHSATHYCVYRCRECDHVTTGRYFAAEHARARHGDAYNSGGDPKQRLLNCGQCGVKLKSKDSLRSHTRRIHGASNRVKREFICDICKITFTTKNRLEVHLVSHDPAMAKKFSYCAQCNVQYKTIHIYRNHLRSTKGHSQGDYKCEVCNKFFASKTYLKSHKEFYHLKKSKFYCQPCDKKFISMFRLHNHRQTQHGESRTKEHACNVCGKAFYTRSSLRDHLLTHSSARSFMCDECGDTFKQRPSLYTHRKLVHMQVKRTRTTKKGTVA